MLNHDESWSSVLTLQTLLTAESVAWRLS